VLHVSALADSQAYKSKKKCVSSDESLFVSMSKAECKDVWGGCGVGDHLGRPWSGYEVPLLPCVR
jgi:hypothetical protein